MSTQEAPRVLFADDDPDTVAMMSVAGGHRGWCVETAISGEEILAKVNAACAEGGPCYNIIVTDVQFFSGGHDIRMTGIAAAREVRRKFPNLPILFLTGFNGAMTRDNVRAIGNAEVIQKGVDLDYLLDRIELLMRWPVTYAGPERRRTSVNRTDHQRRDTDKRLEVPAVLSRAMKATRQISKG